MLRGIQAPSRLDSETSKVLTSCCLCCGCLSLSTGLIIVAVSSAGFSIFEGMGGIRRIAQDDSTTIHGSVILIMSILRIITIVHWILMAKKKNSESWNATWIWIVTTCFAILLGLGIVGKMYDVPIQGFPSNELLLIVFLVDIGHFLIYASPIAHLFMYTLPQTAATSYYDTEVAAESNLGDWAQRQNERYRVPSPTAPVGP